MSDPSFLSPQMARETARRVAHYRASIRLESERADQIPQMNARSGHTIGGKFVRMSERLIARFFAQNEIAASDRMQVREDEQFQRFDSVREGSGHSASPEPAGFENPTAAAVAAHRLSETSK